MAITFPIDLRGRADKNYPFVQFQIAKFRERVLLKDFNGQSSTTFTDGNRQEIQDWQDDVDALLELSVSKPVSEKDAQDLSRRRAEIQAKGLNRAGGTEFIEDIFLPLPQNLQNNYSPNWEMADMILVQGFMDAMAESSVNEGIATMASSLGAALSRSGQFAQKFGAKTPNPKKQALFNGIEPRTFTFDYTFSPQSLQEAEAIDRIVNTFTKYSLPTLDDPASAFFGFPCEYRILFHKTTGFPLINWCVCTGVSTNYSPNIMQLLESGHTTQITLSMSFLETDLRTQERPGV